MQPPYSTYDMNLGPWEIALIFLAILLLFGAKRIPEIARGLGKGIREFKDATNDIKREITLTDTPPQIQPPQQQAYVPPPAPPPAYAPPAAPQPSAPAATEMPAPPAPDAPPPQS